MADSLNEEILKIIKKNLISYKEWMKPKEGDPIALTIIKSIFKGIVALVLVAFSPLVLLILVIAFFAAL